MPEPVGFLTDISDALAAMHCSQHSLQQSTVKFEVQSCQSPIGSVARAVVCNASDPGSSPLLSNRSFFSRVSFPGKMNFKICWLSTICACAWSNWPKGLTHVWYIYRELPSTSPVSVATLASLAPPRLYRLLYWGSEVALSLRSKNVL